MPCIISKNRRYLAILVQMPPLPVAAVHVDGRRVTFGGPLDFLYSVDGGVFGDSTESIDSGPVCQVVDVTSVTCDTQDSPRLR